MESSESGISLYLSLRDQIQTADLIEFRAESPLGYAIRWFTKMPVNHTAGAMLYQLVGDTEIRRYVAEANETDFGLAYLSKKLEGYKGRVYLLKLKPEHDSLRNVVAKEAQMFEHVKYDYLSLLRNAFSPVKIDGKRVYCSEAWHIAIVRAGLLPPEFNGGNGLRPGEFDRTQLFLAPTRIY